MSLTSEDLITDQLCDYGCGQIAKFKISHGKICCSKHPSGCIISKQKQKKNKSPSKGKAIITDQLCDYGCGQIAKFIYKSGKVCCSESYNSCPEKRKQFSELDHTERTEKSLKTRVELGITKSSQIKGGKTRRETGFYDRLGSHMQELWALSPWNNNPKWRNFHDTEIMIQSTYEEEFLSNLERKNGISWVKDNVSRGPHFYYIDPNTNKKRIYLSDFIIDDIIYEIKGWYTWNNKNKDKNLELGNRAKLNAVLDTGKIVILVLEGKEILYEKNISIMDGTLSTLEN